MRWERTSDYDYDEGCKLGELCGRTNPEGVKFQKMFVSVAEKTGMYPAKTDQNP
jgi:hypothetical protein